MIAEAPEAIGQLLRDAPPGTVRVLSGASCSLALVRSAVTLGWLSDPVLVTGDGKAVRWGENGAWCAPILNY